LTLLGVQILLGGFIHTFIQPNMELLMLDVQQGTLDYALTKPEDSQVLISVRAVRIWQVVEVISGLVLLSVGLAGVESSVGWPEALTFAFALGIGAVLVYCFWLILTTGAFWVVRMEHVLELFEGIYQTGRWPVGVYPGWLRYSVTFLVPVALAVAVALASSVYDRALPRDSVFAGELGLGGEVRAVSQAERRIAEAANLGMRRIYLAERGIPKRVTRDIEVIGVRTISDLFRRTFE